MNRKSDKMKNPLIGKEVWILTITNDYGVGETTTAAFTSFRKAMNAAKTEFECRNIMEDWEDAKKDLTEQYFYRDPQIMNGDRFLIDCIKIY